MFTYEVTLAITLVIANTIAMLIYVLSRTNQRTIPSANKEMNKLQNSKENHPHYEAHLYIRIMVEAGNRMTELDDRMKNVQTIYEYLIMHPAILVDSPNVRNVTLAKAKEAQFVCLRHPTASWSAPLQRVLHAYNVTLDTISKLPSYVQ